jgi:hypothetical protein
MVKREVDYWQTITNGEVGKQMKKTGWAEPSSSAILKTGCLEIGIPRTLDHRNLAIPRGKADTSDSTGLSCFPDESHLEEYKPSWRAA